MDLRPVQDADSHLDNRHDLTRINIKVLRFSAAGFECLLMASSEPSMSLRTILFFITANTK